MLKNIFISMTLIFAVNICAQQLEVSESGRFLQYKNGEPFFYLGDTAWELFHRLDRGEAELYLTDRAEKGFTVIQAVVLAELDGLKVPNAYGEVPLSDLDPTRPNEKYFEHVDYIVNKAAELGLFIGMLPTWGDKFNIKWGVGPEIFTPKTAEFFGEYLAERYKDKPIIWILGGDRNCENEEDFSIIDAFAAGIEKVSNNAQLITYHPQGGSNSSDWFHIKEWLDFNMFQSGHSVYDDPNEYLFNKNNYELKPVKPTLNGEPCYEDHPVNWLREGETRWFYDANTRRAAYNGLFAGACGHTFGNHNIWQMWSKKHNQISWARTDWQTSLDYPGAFQMKIMKKFFEKIQWYNFIPDQTLIVGENPEDSGYKLAMHSIDYSTIIAYSPLGESLTLDISQMNGKELKACWFNPRDGEYSKIENFKAAEKIEFKPNSNGIGSDWILVLTIK